jgi:DNA repair protein RadD
VTEVEGDLVELGARQSGKIAIKDWERRRFYSELLGYAEGKGYASGWAAHQYKKKFKDWPDGFDRVAMSPSVSTVNWVRSRQIAWAKARGPPHRRAGGAG